MSAKKKGCTAITLVIGKDDLRVRKAFAPAGRTLPDIRRKEPRRRPDFLAETAERDPE